MFAFSLIAGFREATQREILVPDKPYSVFVALLEYLYTGQSPPFGRLGDPDHDFAFAVELLKVEWVWCVRLLLFVHKEGWYLLTIVVVVMACCQAADEYIVDRLRQVRSCVCVCIPSLTHTHTHTRVATGV